MSIIRSSINMFSSKMLAVFVVAFVLVSSDAQLLAASPYYYPATYSAYYPSVYGTYAAYPAFYGWGSNKGGAPGNNAQAPVAGQKLTDNQ